MKNNVKFGDWFSWEPFDDYADGTVGDPADTAIVINHVINGLSDRARLKKHGINKLTHQTDCDVNGIHLYTFTTDEYTFICHYICADEDQAYLFRHKVLS
jgi:hypothetical protein